jgi:peptidoglycan/xylan/chitin deacetylase (PgdA/CDA1 family)
MDQTERLKYLGTLSDNLGVEIAPSIKSDMYLSKIEIQEMAGNGITFGCHTMNHPDMSRLTDGEIEKEINDSRTVIERVTQKKCDFFAYPFGDEWTFSERTRSILDNNGFEAAVTTEGGFNSFSDDVLELKRIVIPCGYFRNFEFSTIGLGYSLKAMMKI